MMNSDNNNNNNNEEPIYSYDEVFEQHLQEKHEERVAKHNIPVNVKAVPQEEIEKDKKDQEEQERAFKALAPAYCICNHKKSKHVMGVGECEHQGTRMFKGKLETFVCECSQFVSIADKAEMSF